MDSHLTWGATSYWLTALQLPRIGLYPSPSQKTLYQVIPGIRQCSAVIDQCHECYESYFLYASLILSLSIKVFETQQFASRSSMLSSRLATWALTLITAQASNPDSDFGRNQRCADVMANNGLNFSSFWHGAAHGIHSLYLEEVRHFFEPEAKENNKIPVLNPTLSADHVILFDSPLAGYDEDFYTMSLKVQS